MKAKCISIPNPTAGLTVGKFYEIISDPFPDQDGDMLVTVKSNDLGNKYNYYAYRFQSNSVLTQAKETVINMKNDIKNFIVENRAIIYWVAILIVADQWIFEGKFREKLQSIFESLITKVKKQLED